MSIGNFEDLFGLKVNSLMIDKNTETLTIIF